MSSKQTTHIRIKKKDKVELRRLKKNPLVSDAEQFSFVIMQFKILKTKVMPPKVIKR